MGTNLLEVRIGRDFGALKGLRSPATPKRFKPKCGVSIDHSTRLVGRFFSGSARVARYLSRAQAA